MKCPCCGSELALVSAVPVELVVSDVVAPLAAPSPAPQEHHEQWEVRWAVKEIKGARKRLFFQNAEVSWAKTIGGRLFVQVGAYWLPVLHWVDVVDRQGRPFLVEI